MAERSENPIEELLPGYALNALSPDEHVLVERALEREPRYQNMLAAYVDGVAGLASGHEDRQVPPELMGRVLEAIGDGTQAPAPVAEPVRGAAFPMAFWGVAAAFVLAVAGFGTLAGLEYQRVGELEDEMEALVADNGRQEKRLQQQAELAMLSMQPGVQQAAMVTYDEPAPVSQNADGMIVMQPDGKQMLWLMNLDQLPDGYTYQAWLWDGPTDAYSMAVFTPDVDGQAMIDMWMPEHDEPAQLWMTINVEPAGGSVTPSAERVLWGRLN